MTKLAICCEYYKNFPYASFLPHLILAESSHSHFSCSCSKRRSDDVRQKYYARVAAINFIHTMIVVAEKQCNDLVFRCFPTASYSSFAYPIFEFGEFAWIVIFLCLAQVPVVKVKCQ